jgi:cysteine-rich repeat protein
VITFEGLRATALLLLASLSGCTDSKPAPRELTLTPNVGRDDRETPITITGRFIAAILEIDRRDVKNVRPLRVSLGGQPIDAVISGNNRLTATVPVGLAAGPHPLTVVDPLEQTATIEDAFCVLGPAAQVASIAIDAPSRATAGVPFPVAMTAFDHEGLQLDRFDGAVRLSGALDTVVGPFAGGAWTGTLAATVSGTIAIDATVDLSADPARECATAGRGTSPIEVTPAPVTASLVFTTPPRTFTAGKCSQRLELERRDSSGAPFRLELSETVALTGPAGAEFHSDLDCTTPISSIDFAPGGARTRFFMASSVAGPAEVRAATALGVETSQLETVLAAPPVALAFETPPQVLLAGDCSSAVVVGLRDVYGNPTPATADLLIDASEDSDDGDTFSDPVCGTPERTFAIGANGTTTTLYFSAPTPQTMTITVSSSTLTPASQTETISNTAPPALAFASPPFTGDAGGCYGPMTIEARDSSGTPIPVQNDTPVQLTATPSTLFEFHAQGCGGPSFVAVDIPAGATSADVWFVGELAGPVDVFASSAGYQSAMQTQTITAAAPARFVITSAPQVLQLGDCSTDIVAELRDRYGNASVAGSSPLVADLNAFPSANATLMVANCVAASQTLTFPPGESVRPFYFQAERSGSVDLTISAAGMISDTQTETILSSPATSIRFATPPQTISSGDCSPAVIVQTVDGTGTPTPVAMNTTVGLITDAGDDFDVYGDPNCSGAPITGVVIPMGFSTAIFYFSGVTPGNEQISATTVSLGVATQIETVAGIVCGNGTIDPGEECDDLNTNNGDGCSFLCIVEAGYGCARQPSMCFDADTTYFVDDDICPAIGTGSAASPYCQIAFAVNGGRPNVIVRPGLYTGALTITQTVDIFADDGAFLNTVGTAITVDSGVTRIFGLTVSSQMGAGAQVDNSASLTLEQFTVNSAPASSGVRASSSSMLLMNRCFITGSFDGIYLETNGSYDIRNTITVLNTDDGIDCNVEPGGPARLINVTSADNGDAGLDCTADATIDNSIIWGNGGQDLEGGCTPSYCDYQGGPGSPTSISEDPQFDIDYHLLVGSPCIDRASSVGAPVEDFDGQGRPFGAGVDMGADEFQ